MVFFYHLSFVFSSSRLCVFFSRGVDKASNVSRNFNRPSSPVFERRRGKKTKRAVERKFFFLKNNKKKTELKNICD